MSEQSNYLEQIESMVDLWAYNFIGVCGNIGVGKTTLTQLISENYRYIPFYEKPDDNPFLPLFYKDLSHAFEMQVKFLEQFLCQLRKISRISNKNVTIIQDRLINEVIDMFCYNFNNLDLITDDQYMTINNLFRSVIDYLPKPDLLIYVRADSTVLMDRIKQRNRVEEVGVGFEVIDLLNGVYDYKIKSWGLSGTNSFVTEGYWEGTRIIQVE